MASTLGTVVFYESIWLTQTYRFTLLTYTDLPSVYEMPPTAVAWIDHMIGYTVAGGKMNRGLATMACIKSIATSQVSSFLSVPVFSLRSFCQPIFLLDRSPYLYSLLT